LTDSLLGLATLSVTFHIQAGFPASAVVKNLLANAGDVGSMSGLRRSPGRGHGNPLQYSCLENAMDKGTWWVIVHGFEKSQTRLTEHVCARTHMHTCTHTHAHTHTHARTHTILGRWICLERKGLFALMTHSILAQSTVFRVPDNQSKAGSEPNLSCILNSKKFQP